MPYLVRYISGIKGTYLICLIFRQNKLHVKEDNLRISKIFLFPKSDNIKSVKWICYDCKRLRKSFYLSSFFGDFLSHTECPTAPLAFSRERWMLISHFGPPRAMISQNEISPSLWDGIDNLSSKPSKLKLVELNLT